MSTVDIYKAPFQNSCPTKINESKKNHRGHGAASIKIFELLCRSRLTLP